MKTFRLKVSHQPSPIVKPQGYWGLRDSVVPPVQKLIEGFTPPHLNAALPQKAR